MCAHNWPLDDTFKKCADCGEKTDPCANIDSMSMADAVSLKANLDFERFYEKWDAEHDPERLVPDLSLPSAEVS